MSDDDLPFILKMPLWVLVEQRRFQETAEHGESTPRVMLGAPGQADQATFAFFSDKAIADRFISEVMPHNGLMAAPLESASALVKIARSLQAQGWGVIAVDLAKTRAGVRAAQRRSLEAFLKLVEDHDRHNAGERGPGGED
jgi:hypothetical protein